MYNDFLVFVEEKGIILSKQQKDYATLYFNCTRLTQFFDWGKGSNKTLLYSLIREFIGEVVNGNQKGKVNKGS